MTVAVSIAMVVASGAILAVLVSSMVVAVHPSSKRAPSKEDAVHDAESPAGLEHRARLRVAPVIAQAVHLSTADKVPPDIRLRRIVAGSIADAAKVVDCGDESADNSDVDEGHKQGVMRRAVVAEEGENGPGQSKYADNEQDKDRVGR